MTPAVTDYMLTVCIQLQERLRTLSAAGASTWERMPNPGPYLMVVIDELASLSETLKLDSPGCAEFWTATRRVASEGRKAGVLLAIALQNPSRENVDMSLRRLCTRVVFRVQDRDASQIVLGTSEPRVCRRPLHDGAGRPGDRGSVHRSDEDCDPSSSGETQNCLYRIGPGWTRRGPSRK